MVSSQQTRIISLGVYCAATLSSCDAFSLVQNAAASQQSRERDGNDGGSGSGSASRASARSRTASAASRNAFRGSIVKRACGTTNDRSNPQGGSRARDDFSLRMGMQSQPENDDSWMDQEVDLTSSHQDEPSASIPCPNDCRADATSPSSGADADSEFQQRKQLHDRRKFLHGLVSSTAAFATVAAATSSTTTLDPISATATPSAATTTYISPPFMHPQPANAFERTFPSELEYLPSETETSTTSLTKLQEERISVQKAKVLQTQEEFRTDPFGITGITQVGQLQQQQQRNSLTSSSDATIGGLTVAGGMVWALALWFVSGSRSNPLVTPLANVMYEEEKESWLQDRNEGYFGEVPLPLLGVLTTIFVFLGVVVDRSVYFLADGDAEISLQLAGVSVIGGLVWELGRVDSGEKVVSRDEYERETMLINEFGEFAEKRIIVGSKSCHRSDVISAFRRYNPKYRNADSVEYPLADIEIERILRKWNRERGSGAEMSSAGFFSGISIDGAADAFAPR